MKKLIVINFILMYTFVISAQTLINDTTTVMKRGEANLYIRKNWAYQFNIGANYFIYDSKTVNWIGNHRGFVFGFEIERKGIFGMIDMRIFTVNPLEKLTFNNIVLSENAKLNPIRTDLAIGYKYDLKRKVTLNSYIGWMKSSFKVINEDELGKTYKIPSQSGLTVGAGFNYYLELEPYVYSILFLKYNFNLSNYSKINSSLGNSFQSIELGVSFKFWSRRIKKEDQNEYPYKTL